MSKYSNTRLEFGDFQTPQQLAHRMCKLLLERGVRPRAILEPSAGIGNILLAALHAFPSAESAVAVEVNPDHAEMSCSRVAAAGFADRVQSSIDDFFQIDLDRIGRALPEPVLVVGNPPWTTSARLGQMGSSNLPEKRNVKGLKGLDALTGKSNFDLAEWFILRLAATFAKRSATIALLCKTSVARQALLHLWTSQLTPTRSYYFRIDAKREFVASTDACLLVLSYERNITGSTSCDVFSDFDSLIPERTFGLDRGRLVSDLPELRRYVGLLASKRTVWRSGIKHDCAAVMELRRRDGQYENGLGENIDLESTYVFPLLKSTQLFHNRVTATDRAVVVPQRRIGEETASLRIVAPRTWEYLQRHASLLDNRKSRIYRGKPRFSVFGVGDYSFAEWKVCISALHKELRFSLVGPFDGKPTMIDDTAYFLGFDDRYSAELTLSLLDSDEAKRFLGSLIFWDSKRPITSDILGALDLGALAATKGLSSPLRSSLTDMSSHPPSGQADLFARSAT